MKPLTEKEKDAILTDRIIRRIGQTIAGKTNCPPMIAYEIEKRIIREEILLSKEIGYYD
jgi:hypothetical protein